MEQDDAITPCPSCCEVPLSGEIYDELECPSCAEVVSFAVVNRSDYWLVGY